MTSGVPYDSATAHGLCGSITALLHGAANLASAEMAGVVGTFAEYDENAEPMMRVMQMHRNAVERRLRSAAAADACCRHLSGRHRRPASGRSAAVI